MSSDPSLLPYLHAWHAMNSGGEEVRSGCRHDICQDVYTSRLWTNYILPKKSCNVLHFRTKQGKICLRQVHIDQGGQNVKMSAQAIQGASSENS